MEKLVPCSSPKALTEAVVLAASQKDWDRVDRIAPLAAEMDGDGLVDCLYRHTRSTDLDIRDGAMTVWSYLNPKDYRTKHIHWGRAMDEMAMDEHECPAVWAAVTVCRYIDDPDPYFSEPAKIQLEKFRLRIKTMDEREKGDDWQKTRDFVVEKTKNRLPRLGELI